MVDCLNDYDAILHSYCLMGNHYHLILETPRGNLSRIIQRLNTVYSQLFNRRHHRVGHVFQGRFDSRLVQKESHLHQASRYIALNPVRAGLVKAPEEWQWGSYRALAGYIKVPEWLENSQTLKAFGVVNGKSRLILYRRFVMKDAQIRNEKKPSVWATKEYIENIRKRIRHKEVDPEYTKKQRFVSRPTLADLFGEKLSGLVRDAMIYRAFKACGYTESGIARKTGLSVSRVSRIIKLERAKGKV